MNALQLMTQPAEASGAAVAGRSPIARPVRALRRPAAAARPAPGTPLHRAIMAVDIESSTTRTNPVKAQLRSTLYTLFAAALEAAGIQRRHRDPFDDRGDGILALIHPVDQAPKTLLMNRAVPDLARRLAAHNASLPVLLDPRLRLRLRVVLHAGEIHYDDNGCFGEALDIAFRLLDAAAVKKALAGSQAPLVLVVSSDIFRSLVCHGYEGIDEHAFAPHVRIRVAGHQHRGWLHTPACPAADHDGMS
jgi:class 3 adenylate cyclase